MELWKLYQREDPTNPYSEVGGPPCEACGHELYFHRPYSDGTGGSCMVLRMVCSSIGAERACQCNRFSGAIPHHLVPLV